MRQHKPEWLVAMYTLLSTLGENNTHGCYATNRVQIVKANHNSDQQQR